QMIGHQASLYEELGLDPTVARLPGDSATLANTTMDDANRFLLNMGLQVQPSLLESSEFQTYADIVEAMCRASQSTGTPLATTSAADKAILEAFTTGASNPLLSSPSNDLGLAGTSLSGDTTSSHLTLANSPTFDFMLTPTTPGFSNVPTTMDELLTSCASNTSGLFSTTTPNILGTPESISGATAYPNANLSPLAMATLQTTPADLLQAHKLFETSELGSTGGVVSQAMLDIVSGNQKAQAPPTTTLPGASPEMLNAHSTTRPTGIQNVFPHSPATAKPKRPSSGMSGATQKSEGQTTPETKKPRKTLTAQTSTKSTKASTTGGSKRSRKRQTPPSPPQSPSHSSSSPPPVTSGKISPQQRSSFSNLWNLKAITPHPPTTPIPISAALDTNPNVAPKVTHHRLHSSNTASTLLLPSSPLPQRDLKRPGPGNPPVKNQRRIAHNAIERRYRNNINDRIRELKDSIPALVQTQQAKDEENLAALALQPGDSRQSLGRESKTLKNTKGLPKEVDGIAPANKLNKATVLRKATEYVWHLRKTNYYLRREHDTLRQLVLENVANGAELLQLIERQAQDEAEAYIKDAKREQEEDLLQSSSPPGEAVDDEGDTVVPQSNVMSTDMVSPLSNSSPPASMAVSTSVASDSDSSSNPAESEEDRARSGATTHTGTGLPLRALMGVFLCASFFTLPGSPISYGDHESTHHRTLSAFPVFGTLQNSWARSIGHVFSTSDLLLWIRFFVFATCLLGLMFYDDWFGPQRRSKNQRYWKARYGTWSSTLAASLTGVGTVRLDTTLSGDEEVSSGTQTLSSTADPANTAPGLKVIKDTPNAPENQETVSERASRSQRRRSRRSVVKTLIGSVHEKIMNDIEELNNTPLPRSYRSIFLRIGGELLRLVAPQACLPEKNSLELSLLWLRLSEFQLFHEDVALPSLMKVHAWLRSFSLGSTTPNYSLARSWIVAAMHVHKSVRIRYIRNLLLRRMWNWAVQSSQLSSADRSTSPLLFPGMGALTQHLDREALDNRWQWLFKSPGACEYFLEGEWKPFTRSSAYTVEWPRLQLVFGRNPTNPMATLTHLFALNQIHLLLRQFTHNATGYQQLANLLANVKHVDANLMDHPGDIIKESVSRGGRLTAAPLLLQWYLYLALAVMAHRLQRTAEREDCLQQALLLTQQIMRQHMSGETGLNEVERQYACITLEVLYLSILPAVLVETGQYHQALCVANVVALRRKQRRQLETCIWDAAMAGSLEDKPGVLSNAGGLDIHSDSKHTTALSRAVDPSLSTIMLNQTHGVGLSSLLVSLCTSSNDHRSHNSTPATRPHSVAAKSNCPSAALSGAGGVSSSSCRIVNGDQSVFSPATKNQRFALVGSSLPVMSKRRPANNRAVRVLYQYTCDIERYLDFLVSNILVDARYHCLVHIQAGAGTEETDHHVKQAQGTGEEEAVVPQTIAVVPEQSAGNTPGEEAIGKTSPTVDLSAARTALVHHLAHLRQLAVSVCDVSCSFAYIERYEQMGQALLQSPGDSL
ncbi:hypothetical protein IWQ62_003523, partial [Dispira parvispora]